MFNSPIVLAAAILAIVNLVYATAKYKWLAIIPALIVGGLSFSSLVKGQVVLLVVIVLAMSALKKPWTWFAPSSLVATAVAFAIAIWSAIGEQREFQRLREAYPMVSLESRLPKAPPRISQSLAVDQSLADSEATLGDINPNASDAWRRPRTLSMRQLHNRELLTFANSAGFGRERFIRPRAEALLHGERTDPPIPQPSMNSGPIDPTESTRLTAGASAAKPWLPMHQTSVVDFVNAENFGYLTIDRKAAGFQEHRFSKTPAASQPWRIETVELVGLLKHDPPAVYVSNYLPRMDQLAGAPTRPLDAFEKDALRQIRSGVTLAVGEGQHSLRMLGAIRAMKQCVDCHDCERGELLGAFSYRLAKADGSPVGANGP